MTNRDLQLLKEIVDIFIPKCVPEYVRKHLLRITGK